MNSFSVSPFSEHNTARHYIHIDTLSKEQRTKLTKQVQIVMECNADFVSEYWADFMIGDRPINYRKQGRQLGFSRAMRLTLRSFLNSLAGMYYTDTKAQMDAYEQDGDNGGIEYQLHITPTHDYSGDAMSIKLMRQIEANRMTGVRFTARLYDPNQDDLQLAISLRVALLTTRQRKIKEESEALNPCRVSWDIDDDGEYEFVVSSVDLIADGASLLIDRAIDHQAGQGQEAFWNTVITNTIPSKEKDKKDL